MSRCACCHVDGMVSRWWTRRKADHNGTCIREEREHHPLSSCFHTKRKRATKHCHPQQIVQTSFPQTSHGDRERRCPWDDWTSLTQPSYPVGASPPPQTLTLIFSSQRHLDLKPANLIVDDTTVCGVTKIAGTPTLTLSPLTRTVTTLCIYA